MVSATTMTMFRSHFLRAMHFIFVSYSLKRNRTQLSNISFGRKGQSLESMKNDENWKASISVAHTRLIHCSYSTKWKSKSNLFMCKGWNWIEWRKWKIGRHFRTTYWYLVRIVIVIAIVMIESNQKRVTFKQWTGKLSYKWNRFSTLFRSSYFTRTSRMRRAEKRR